MEIYGFARAAARRKAARRAPPEQSAKDAARNAGVFDGLGVRRIVFVSGYFAPELSDLADLEPGLSIVSLSKALASDDAAAISSLGKVGEVDDPTFALNTAFMGEGVVIRVKAGSVVERPIELVFVAGPQPATYFLRSLIVVEKSARVSLIESRPGRRRQRISRECGN